MTNNKNLSRNLTKSCQLLRLASFKKETHSHFHASIILNILKLKPNVTNKELAKTFNLSLKPIDKILNRLVKKGWITVTKDESDLELKFVNLTEEGTNFDPETAINALLATIMSEEELTELNTLLEKLMTGLKPLAKDASNDDDDDDNEESFAKHFRGSMMPYFGHCWGHGHHHHRNFKKFTNLNFFDY